MTHLHCCHQEHIKNSLCHQMPILLLQQVWSINCDLAIKYRFKKIGSSILMQKIVPYIEVLCLPDK